MEDVLSHVPGMDDESSLGKWGVHIVWIIVKVILRESPSQTLRESARGWWLHQIRSAQLAFFADDDDAPVIESTLPELTKVDCHLNTLRCHFNKVPVLDLVPSQDCVMG